MILKKLELLLGGMSKESQLSFLETFLKELIVKNRSFWSDDEYSDSTKVDCLKWSNELSHRFWNMKGDIEDNKELDFLKRFIKHLKFYAEQNKVFASHLGGSINLVLSRNLNE
tara:strand:+ start:1102 stop:1440 length:339 start_codon:yes stop_codon:yes gene_type:complete